jgi:hypothetical protein
MCQFKQAFLVQDHGLSEALTSCEIMDVFALRVEKQLTDCLHQNKTIYHEIGEENLELCRFGANELCNIVAMSGCQTVLPLEKGSHH